MAWYDRLLGTASKPFAGVGESFEDLNIFGASVPESFKQMNTAGLLGPGVIKKESVMLLYKAYYLLVLKTLTKELEVYLILRI